MTLLWEQLAVVVVVVLVGLGLYFWLVSPLNRRRP